MPASSWTRVLFEAIDDAVFVHDEEGRILDANPAACRRLGYSHEELLQLTTRDIDAPEFAAGFEGRLKSQLAMGGIRCEGVHRTKDGRRIHVDINTSAIQLDGKPAVLAVMRDITQRKQTEEALNKQSELLQSILASMTDAVVVADARGQIVLFNPMAERIFGPEFKHGQANLFEADRTTRVKEFPTARCVRGESFDGCELFAQHTDPSQHRWIRVAGRPLRERSGAIKGGVLVCSDITEQKRAEESLRDSQAIYESLVEGLPQHIFRKDRDSKILFANQRYCADLSRNLAELRGKSDLDFFPEELAKKYIDDDRRVMDSGKNVDTIEEHVGPDGNRMFVHVVKAPVFNADRDVVGVQGIFWDVTDEVLAQQAVTNSERRYRQLTEATMDGIIVIDRDGNIALFNPAAERMFGYAALEVLGAPAGLLVPDEFKELHDEGVSRFIRTRLPELLGQPREFKAKRKDGSEFPVEIALSLLADTSGAGNADSRPTQVLAAIRDLTERNKMRSLMVQNEKLASIGLLSAGVAHEINNPLAFVGNNLVVLERDCKGLLDLLSIYESAQDQLALAQREQIQNAAGTIDLAYIKESMPRILSRTREGIDRVSRIVHSLRGMARTEAPRRQDVKGPDLVNSSLEILHGRFKRLGVTVTQTHEPNLMVPCVPTQISQVVLNLLVNAFQAIESADRRDGRIDIQSRRHGSEFVLEIQDNGPGIAADHVPRLFDPFFTTKEVGEGTGLGLSISHHIISAHGGRIEVDSKPGVGALFRVYLPLKERA